MVTGDLNITGHELRATVRALHNKELRQQDDCCGCKADELVTFSPNGKLTPAQLKLFRELK